MSVRRRTDPAMTQRIWDAIKITINQRSLPSNDRIVRHFARVYNMTEHAAQEELNTAVSDGLVFLKKVQTKSGIDQDSYRLPLEPAEDDGHDWYCYECHKAGHVVSCRQCFRVFHYDCHLSNEQDDKICEFCEEINADEKHTDVAALNHILSFTCGHLRAKLPQEITNRKIVGDSTAVEVPPGALVGPTWISEGEDAWRPGMLIKKHMDLTIMEEKTKRNEYKCLAEFQADAHNIMHNIIIYHGKHSTIGDMGVTMYQDCCYDLKEIRRCADCYRISNEKPEKMWFCIPCNPPHQLVYAKQKGYPYWPAKVMEIKHDLYDVRFFGGHHMRANIEKVFIKPITASLQSLQIKRSSAWNKAFEELKHHQNLLSKIGKKNDNAGGAEEEEGEEEEDDKDGLKPPKMRNIGTKTSQEGNNGAGSRSTSEDRQVPLLPVAEDEPPREISSTCPLGLKKEGSQEDMVTSSSQEPRTKSALVQTDQSQTEVVPAKVKRERRTSEQPTTTGLEKLRREMELDKCRELERLQNEHAKELRQLTDKHQQVISEIKKKQWCYNCEAEAIYHCCWNTAYCSTDCQQVHWQREHKRVCRRKR